jgi:hypothetical protein
MGDTLPPDIGLRWDMAGTALSIDLMYAGAWEQTFAKSPPRILLASGARAENKREATWERMAPGHYRATVDLGEGEVVRGAIQAGDHALPFGPLTAGSNVEWAFDPARVEELRQVAAQTGGRELVDLASAWQSPPLRELTDLRRWLLPLALLLIIADALITRMGWRMPTWALVKPGRAERAAVPGPKAAPLPVPALAEQEATASAPEPEPAVSLDEDAERRRSRFARARKR